ncbi:MAG: hypothetical protein PHC68_00355 [Syntrophorhabdaceae bacterium]|nr:hypothetical protein [Syntrophorhabdaceae bacterium]
MTVKTEQVLSGVAPDRANGQVQCAWGHFTYADDGAVAAAEVMQMVQIPKNARIIDILLSWSALAITIGVGDGSDTTGWYSALDLTNAGQCSLFGGVANNAEIDEGPNNYQPGKVYSAAADTIDVIPSGAIGATFTLDMCVMYDVRGGFSDY